MNIEAIPIKKVHHGRNVKRLREMLGIKQEILAEGLGLSQQTVSRFESQEELEDDILNKIAKVLHLPAESIKNFDEEDVINIIYNTFNSNDHSTLNAINHECTFNPLDKVIQLYDEKMKLYERLLKTEQERNSLLEKLLTEKK